MSSRNSKKTFPQRKMSSSAAATTIPFRCCMICQGDATTAAATAVAPASVLLPAQTTHPKIDWSRTVGEAIEADPFLIEKQPMGINGNNQELHEDDVPLVVANLQKNTRTPYFSFKSRLTGKRARIRRELFAVSVDANDVAGLVVASTGKLFVPVGPKSDCFLLGKIAEMLKNYSYDNHPELRLWLSAKLSFDFAIPKIQDRVIDLLDRAPSILDGMVDGTFASMEAVHAMKGNFPHVAAAATIHPANKVDTHRLDGF
ncbi:hypothetical protein IV203_000076 [Nitzschia inconspicua]|uniref:Uncharacterized protein n=1 Tax=Nitzschia inconspicua TaxID=303405 RepID=A0A9K3PPM3_9STRA|nr:hypothetical protein IV203_000076 [Nitzschia inconspicua]